MESEILMQLHRRILMDFLDVLVLLKLRNGMLSDYEILSYIQRRFNMPMTPGIVYSCLNQLQENKLVREVHQRKKKSTC
ncbi:MAG: hypothetical protein QHH18_07360 [Candidatus Bathyarchaeota archaeon]|nr:hypothetical protein [Candidatus Bathyarchaeota archaeon A05DMB-5]MDH7558399.1 hypothetical protein [Candidatus Bathyarchaeota archaeon]